MAEVIGLVASITGLLDATPKIVNFIYAMRDASKDMRKFMDEVQLMTGRLSCLQMRLEDPESSTDWSENVASLLASAARQVRDELNGITKDIEPATSGFKKIGKVVTWPFIKDTIVASIERIVRLNSYIDYVLEDELNKLSIAIREDTKTISADTAAIRTDASAIRDDTSFIAENKRRKNHEKIVFHIAQQDFSQKHRTNLKEITSETGKWFLEHEVFQNWINGTSGALWCKGIPGAGKTTLVSIAVQYLQHRFAGQDDTMTAYVFCDYGQRKQQKPRKMLASLWSQFMGNRTLSQDEFNSLNKDYMGRRRTPDLEAMTKLLRQEIGRYSKVFIIVDALDEFSPLSSAEVVRNETEDSGPDNPHHDDLLNRRQLLTALRDLHPSVRLLVTSRLHPHESFGLNPVTVFDIAARDEDLRTYISHRIELDPKIKRLTLDKKDLADEIERTITQKAQGMFLLARLHMDSICGKSTAKAVRKLLEKLPTGHSAVDTTYGQALDRIMKQHTESSEFAERIFYWLSYSQRPLSATELQYVVSLQAAIAEDPDDTDIEEDGLIDTDSLIQSCAGLVFIDPWTNTVRFVHKTAQEYFVEECRRRFPKAQIHMTEACVADLCREDFSDDEWLMDRGNVSDMIKRFTFLEYAANNWGFHAKCALDWGIGGDREEAEGDIVSLVDKLFDCNPKFSLATRVFLRNQAKHQRWEHQIRGDLEARDMEVSVTTRKMNYAAFFGLDFLIEKLMQEDERCIETSLDERLGSVLHWVSLGEIESTMSLVCDHPGTARLLNVTGGRGFAPLHLAVYQRKSKAVAMLLEAGANAGQSVDSRYWGSSLHVAADSGHADIVSLLLATKEGQDTVVEDSALGDTPLHRAARWGNAQAMKRLMDAIDSVTEHPEGLIEKVPGGPFGGVLTATRQRAPQEPLELILQALVGQEPTADNEDSSPGLELDIDLLDLDRQARTASLKFSADKMWSDMAATSFLLSTPAGQAACVPLLADYPARGHLDLVLAVMEESQEPFPLLVKHPVQSERRVVDRPRSTVLHSTAWGGSIETMSALLEKVPQGRSLDARDDEGMTALMVAASNGHDEVCDLLLRRGANVRAEDPSGHTAMYYAGRGEFDTVIELLQTAKTARTEAARPSPLGRNRGAAHVALEELIAQRQLAAMASSATYPRSPRDQFETAFCIKSAFKQATRQDVPHQVLSQIVDSAEYWLVSTTDRSGEAEADRRTGDNLTYLRSLPVIGRKTDPVKKIVFSITSHDQGWSDDDRSRHNTYFNSWTWFDAWSEHRAPEQAYAAPARNKGPKIVYNLHASEMPKRHEICWPPEEGGRELREGDNPDEVRMWMKGLRAGDRVCIVQHAEFPAWRNYAQRARMSVYSSCLR